MTSEWCFSHPFTFTGTSARCEATMLLAKPVSGNEHLQDLASLGPGKEQVSPRTEKNLILVKALGRCLRPIIGRVSLGEPLII